MLGVKRYYFHFKSQDLVFGFWFKVSF